MPDDRPTLHMLCGKIAAGKSTLAHRLADTPGGILLDQDSWLARLYPGEIASLDDYVRCSGRLRSAVGPHVIALLGAGLSVVLDYPANTVAGRIWMRGLFEAAAAAHVLHWLDVPDTVCKQRLRQRNRDGQHDFAPSEADFELFTQYFVPPSPAEGFSVQAYSEANSTLLRGVQAGARSGDRPRPLEIGSGVSTVMMQRQ